MALRFPFLSLFPRRAPSGGGRGALSGLAAPFSPFARLFAPSAPAEAPPRERLLLHHAPAVLYAVGDVHGCRRLYLDLEARIRADAARQAPDAPVLIVLLGDMVDRGAHSAQMLDLLCAPPPPGVERLALMGNHEAMFLEFLEDPRPRAPWLIAHGGDRTLMSYGLAPDPEHGFQLNARRLRAMIDAAIPAAHLDLLRALPVSLRIPGYLMCHAGLNPAQSLSMQTDHDLMWADPALLDAAAPQDAPAHAAAKGRRDDRDDRDQAPATPPGVLATAAASPATAAPDHATAASPATPASLTTPASNARALPRAPAAALADMRTQRIRLVHGHVPGRRVAMGRWRIGVDTGAYATGRLSAVRLCPGAAPEVLEVDAGTPSGAAPPRPARKFLNPADTSEGI